MIICGTWFRTENTKTKTNPNTKFVPIFNGRSKKNYERYWENLFFLNYFSKTFPKSCLNEISCDILLEWRFFVGPDVCGEITHAKLEK